MISIDIPQNKVHLEVNDETLAQRKAHWQPPAAKFTRGWLARYASLVTSANTGAILQVNENNHKPIINNY